MVGAEVVEGEELLLEQHVCSSAAQRKRQRARLHDSCRHVSSVLAVHRKKKEWLCLLCLVPR